jgi:lipid II:glycine glycyltransferase (peptidoglycan interpeptide bridge formation enzyme)
VKVSSGEHLVATIAAKERLSDIDKKIKIVEEEIEEVEKNIREDEAEFVDAVLEKPDEMRGYRRKRRAELTGWKDVVTKGSYVLCAGEEIDESR